MSEPPQAARPARTSRPRAPIHPDPRCGATRKRRPREAPRDDVAGARPADRTDI